MPQHLDAGMQGRWREAGDAPVLQAVELPAGVTDLDAGLRVCQGGTGGGQGVS